MKGGIIIVEVKIIGANCSNGMKLKKVIERTLDNGDFDINLILVNDSKAKDKYHIKNIPALVIDGEVKSEGKVLTEREFKKLLA